MPVSEPTVLFDFDELDMDAVQERTATFREERKATVAEHLAKPEVIKKLVGPLSYLKAS